MVTLKALADELGMDRSHLRKYVLKMEIKPNKIRRLDSGNQPTLAVTDEEAEQIRRRRADEGYQRRQGDDRLRMGNADEGWFYIVRPDGECRPGRVKLGFTGDLGDRIADYRTIAPGAEYVANVECRRNWEATVREGLSNLGCLRWVTGEVFDCDGDVQVVVDHLQAISAVLNGRDINTAHGA